jgi:hypothetical protein
VNVTVANADTTPPTVSITAPAGGATVSGTITIAATAADNVSVANVQFRVNGANLGAPDTASPYSVSWNTIPGGNGSFSLTAVATDGSGNQTTSAPVTVTVANDLTPPTVSITAPSGGATVSGTVTITANAADNVTVASVQFLVNGAALGAPDTTSPYSASWNTTTGGNGSFTLTAVATDGAGNQTTSAPVTVTVSNAAPSGLVAAYAFNETSGTTAADASGNGRTGTVSGAAWNTGGRYGGALNFDGINDWVTVADANALDLTTGVTLSAWVRPTAVSNWRTVIMKETNASLTYGLYAGDSSGLPAFWVTVGDVYDFRSITGPSLVPVSPTWTHVAATFDGTTMRLYVNGTQVASLAQTSPIATSSSPLRIGGNSAWGEYFAGSIDDVRVYNRALSATEIQTDMNTPLGGGGAP